MWCITLIDLWINQEETEKDVTLAIIIQLCFECLSPAITEERETKGIQTGKEVNCYCL